MEILVFHSLFTCVLLTANSVMWNIDGGVISIRFGLLNDLVTSANRS